MANQVVMDARVWLGALDLSGDANATALDYGVEALDDTALADTARSRTAGLRTIAAQCEGWWNDAHDAALHGDLGISDVPLSLCPVAGAAEGAIAYIFLANTASFSRRAEIGGLFRFSAGAEARGAPLVRGSLLHNAARTASGNGGAWQLGSVGASQRMYAALHVLAVSGGSPSLAVKIQSDDASGFASPTDRIVFAAKTAAGYEWASASGPIADDWWRVSFTISGTSPSFTFVVAAGIA